ncbi:hypothetical protein [Tardiphaga sp.]|uniref:hypothetical protein n=1 Tax=Tardiphaga sp. TaxID=1926292 RepID=UPI0026190924|nr:hypothetical protein [Tardiphaga sp.]MDB5620543.1 hypothetical protein [Tardiphaga sp.]
MRKHQINGVDVTEREAEIFAVLTNEPQGPWQIAEAAGIQTFYKGETGSRYCHSLTRKGLAQKHGMRNDPKWSLPASKAVS